MERKEMRFVRKNEKEGVVLVEMGKVESVLIEMGTRLKSFDEIRITKKQIIIL